MNATTFQDWLNQLNAMQNRADRIRWSIHKRAVALLNQAGTGPGCAAHNAIVSYENGKPWREVNYKLLRRGNWEMNRQFMASDIVRRWYDRTYWDAMKLPRL